MLINFSREDINIPYEPLSNDEMEIEQQDREILMWINSTERIDENALYAKLQQL